MLLKFLIQFSNSCYPNRFRNSSLVGTFTLRKWTRYRGAQIVISLSALRYVYVAPELFHGESTQTCLNTWTVWPAGPVCRTLTFLLEAQPPLSLGLRYGDQNHVWWFLFIRSFVGVWLAPFNASTVHTSKKEAEVKSHFLLQSGFGEDILHVISGSQTISLLSHHAQPLAFYLSLLQNHDPIGVAWWCSSECCRLTAKTVLSWYSRFCVGCRCECVRPLLVVLICQPCHGGDLSRTSPACHPMAAGIGCSSSQPSAGQTER